MTVFCFRVETHWKLHFCCCTPNKVTRITSRIQIDKSVWFGFIVIVLGFVKMRDVSTTFEHSNKNNARVFLAFTESEYFNF